MKLNSLALAIIAGSCCAVTFAAQNDALITKTNNDGISTALYWTPERLRDAKPLDTPRVGVHPRIPAEQYVNNARLGDPDGGDGKPPEVDLKPDLHQIFQPKEYVMENFEVKAKPSFDRGTRNRHFSSTQLVPLTADLSYPYRTVGKLFFTIPGSGNYVCSASVLRPRVVLTAGHCVHRGSGGSAGYYTNWLFIPAYREGAAPFQQWSWAYAIVASGWATGGGGVPNGNDYAMLEMRDLTISGTVRTIGSVTGYLGYQLQSLTPNHVNLLGYPCNFDSCRKMHQVTAQSASVDSAGTVEYGSDMSGGSSGGPWVQNFGVYSVGQSGGLNSGINRVVGVTSWGYTNSALKAQGASNFGTQFTTILNNVCAHRAGNC